MTDGRQDWFAQDTGWDEREPIVEVLEEYGPPAWAVLNKLTATAKRQRASGEVKHGFRSLARQTYLATASDDPAGLARAIVEAASRSGALDDLVVDEDGKRFVCRVSGFRSDQAKARAAARQETQRDKALRSVTERDDQSPTGQYSSSSLRSELSVEPAGSTPPAPAAVVRELFELWQRECQHPAAKLTVDRRRKIGARLREGFTPQQIATAIQGAAVAAFVDDSGRRHDDIELICRNGSKLESFIDRAGRHAPNSEDAVAFVDRINQTQARLQAESRERLKLLTPTPDEAA